MEHSPILLEDTLYSLHLIEILNLQFPNINKLPNTIHKKIYDEIATSNPPATLITQQT